MLITLSVELGARSYPILIGNGLLTRRGVLDPHLRHRDVMVVTNETVGPIYLEPVKALLAGSRLGTTVLPDGEQHKTMATVNHVLDALVAGRYGRDGILAGGLLRRTGLLGGLAWRPLGCGLLDRGRDAGRRICCVPRSRGGSCSRCAVWLGRGLVTEQLVFVGGHVGVFPSSTWRGPHPGQLALIAAWCAVVVVSRAGCGRDGSRIATSRGSRLLARHRLRCRWRPDRQPMDRPPSRLRCAEAPAPAESPGVVSAA